MFECPDRTNEPVMGPDCRIPFPVFGNLRIGGQNYFAQSSKHFTPPVSKVSNLFVDLFRWIHWFCTCSSVMPSLKRSARDIFKQRHVSPHCLLSWCRRGARVGLGSHFNTDAVAQTGMVLGYVHGFLKATGFDLFSDLRWRTKVRFDKAQVALSILP
jgi:hypothetical protein